MKQKDAKLRVCASCEWIFKTDRHPETGGCPKCGFAHYGARFVYGDAAYRHALTQKPWFDKKVADYSCKLYSEIRKTIEKPTRRTINNAFWELTTKNAFKE